MREKDDRGGRALAAYRKRKKISPLSLDSRSASRIDQWIERGIVSRLDRYLANRGLAFLEKKMSGKEGEKVKGGNSEGLMYLWIHLLQATRAGHLCIHIKEDGVVPYPTLWLEEEEAHKIVGKMIRAFQQLDTQVDQDDLWHIVWDLPKKSSPRKTSPRKAFEKASNERSSRKTGAIYLRRLWEAESQVLFHLRRLAHSPPKLKIDEKELEAFVTSVSDQLLPCQLEAIRCAATHSVMLLSGGPGTGKTYTAAYLIEHLAQASLQSDRSHPTAFEASGKYFAFAAPTGKAAANLKASLSARFPHGIERGGAGELAQKELQKDRSIEVSTLHRLLGITPSRGWSSLLSFRAEPPLAAGVVVVDEASMVDMEQMARLLQRIRSGCRLILIGDRHQLPPVESGNFFADLMKGDFPVGKVELDTSVRAESQGLVVLSEAVKQGSMAQLEAALSLEGWTHHPLPTEPIKLMEALLPSFASPEFLSPETIGSLDLQEGGLIQESLKLFDQFRLLSPLRRGYWGIEGLNRLFYTAFFRSLSPGAWMRIPIVITQNHRRLGLTNGQTGLLVTNPFDRKHPGKGYFLVHGRLREIFVPFLPRYQMAYCLSIHQSQGSEFDAVGLILPDQARLTRSLLYTGITRAKKEVRLFGSFDSIERALETVEERISGTLL